MLLLATELYATYGGIQTHTRRIAEVLSSYCKTIGDALHCLSLADHEQSAEFAGFYPARRNRLRYINAAIESTVRHRENIAIVAHISLAPLAAMLKALGLIKQYVVVLHGNEAWRKQSLARRMASGYADALITITDYTARAFRAANPNIPAPLYIIPLSLPNEALPPLDIERRSQSFSILTVGRQLSCERYKGTDMLIGSVARLRKTGAQVRLTIVGEGDDIPRLKKLANGLPPTAVTFLSRLPAAELRKQYAEADVFVMPSSAEGFGIVFLESMREGTPCIAHRRGGSSEVIEDGVSGLLVDGEDELERALWQLYKEPQRRLALGKAGRDAVEAKYLVTHMEQRWHRMLDNVTRGRIACVE